MKRYALLIEVLIGLSLTTTLLGILVVTTVQLNTLSKRSDGELASVAASCLTQKRLTQILTAITGSLSTSDPGVVFMYNRGVDPNPKFSADVLGRLYVEGKELILATWPNPNRFPDKDPPHKTEVLATGVKSSSFAFYNPPPMEEGKKDPPIPYGWQPEWKMEWDDLPLMIRLELNNTLYTVTLPETHKLTFPKKT